MIVEGAHAAWPLTKEIAQSQSALEVLRARIGTFPARWTECTREHHGRASFGYTPDGSGANFDVESHAGDFNAFADVAEDIGAADSGRLAYMQAMPVRFLPPIADALFAFDFMLRHVEITTGLWVGTGDHVSQLHYDFFHNFLFVLEGEKHVWLHPFTPEGAGSRADRFARVAPGPFDVGPGDTPGSLLRWDGGQEGAPDLGRLQDAASLRAVLRPGDMLYIPPFWWHAVASFGRNVMVNSWTATGVPESFQALPMVLDGLVLAAQSASARDRTAFAAICDSLGKEASVSASDAPPIFAPVFALMLDVIGAAKRPFDKAALVDAFATLGSFYSTVLDGPAVPPALLERAKARAAASD